MDITQVSLFCPSEDLICQLSNSSKTIRDVNIVLVPERSYENPREIYSHVQRKGRRKSPGINEEEAGAGEDILFCVEKRVKWVFCPLKGGLVREGMFSG